MRCRGPADIRAAAGAVVYLTLIALPSLGAAAAVRDSAAAIGLVPGVLYLLPLAADVVSNPALARHLDQIGPLPAGLDAQATIGLNSLPLTPWQGLGVVALWTIGALPLGALVLKSRDASRLIRHGSVRQDSWHGRSLTPLQEQI